MLQRFTERMPEYQDMKAEFDKTHNETLYNKMQSYMIHMAVFDKENHKIETLHYGLFRKWFAEMFDVARIPEVEQAIYNIHQPQ